MSGLTRDAPSGCGPCPHRVRERCPYTAIRACIGQAEALLLTAAALRKLSDSYRALFLSGYGGNAFLMTVSCREESAEVHSGRRRHDRGGTCRRGRSCPLRQKRVLYEKPENGAGKSLSDQTVQEKSQEASIPSESRRKRTLRITRHDRKDGVREKERTNKGREQGRVRRKRCRLDLEKTDDASRQDSHGVSFPFSSKWSSAWYPAVRELTSFWLHPSPSARPGHPPFFSDSWD